MLSGKRRPISLGLNVLTHVGLKKMAAILQTTCELLYFDTNWTDVRS